MRKSSAALALLSLAALALTGCSSASFNGTACDRASSTSGIDGVASVSGDVGEAPKVEVYTPLHASTTSFTDVVTGTGTALTSPTQLMVVDIALYGGDSGEQIVSTEFNGDLSRLSNIDSWSQRISGIAQVLECATAGTRVLAAITPEDFGEDYLAGFELGADETVVAVIDVVKTYLPRAEGELQFHESHGLPTVVRAPDGRPGIIVPDTEPPTELVTQVLIKGDGAKVTADTPFRAHYTGVTWAERTVFDSSWNSNAVKFDLSATIPGFTQALEGQTVGSQVLIVVPPELGYGDQAQSGIPADSTLVFVVDILGIDPAATAE